MPAEYEAKILDIDPATMAALILSKGGQQLTEATLQRRHVYDIAEGDTSRWIRLRSNGTETTLATKHIAHDGIDGVQEVEVAVTSPATTLGDPFADTNTLLGMLGFTPKGYQENRRTSFLLDGAHLDIDEWPLIPPYLEIEADSPDEVHRVAALLGYDPSQLTSQNTTKIYTRYGIDLTQLKEVTFP
ncbi:CYTH domain-containing protein [Longispora sp. NPDC051575]|uniref:class IV adenylate cyclase n=1 Tax=Longispora sp. NPDC051575 TaxID=3154943 RepID=UPI003417DA6A